MSDETPQGVKPQPRPGHAKLTIEQWSEVEGHYRAGVASVESIARKYGIHAMTIHKKAKKEGWVRDLTQQIDRRRAELERIEAAETGLISEQDQQLIEANAQHQHLVLRSHRKDLAKSSMLVERLRDEVGELTSDKGKRLVEQMIEALESGDLDTIAAAAKKATSMPQRVRAAVDLVSAQAKLIQLERQAYGIDRHEQTPGETLDAALDRIARSIPDDAL